MKQAFISITGREAGRGHTHSHSHNTHRRGPPRDASDVAPPTDDKSSDASSLDPPDNNRPLMSGELYLPQPPPGTV